MPFYRAMSMARRLQRQETVLTSFFAAMPQAAKSSPIKRPKPFYKKLV